MMPAEFEQLAGSGVAPASDKKSMCLRQDSLIEQNPLFLVVRPGAPFVASCY